MVSDTVCVITLALYLYGSIYLPIFPSKHNAEWCDVLVQEEDQVRCVAPHRQGEWQ